MPNITDNVSFDHIAREWRCKWSSDDDKASLVAAQGVLDECIDQLRDIDGVLSVQRIVCGSCQDFKVIVKLSAVEYHKWAKKNHEPEEDVLKSLEKIEGISNVETQTFTLEEVL